jgi:hypothetical protein
VAGRLGPPLTFLVLIWALAGCGSALPAPDSDYVRSTAGGYVLADPPPGITVSLGAKPFLNAANAATMTDRGAASSPR